MYNPSKKKDTLTLQKKSRISHFNLFFCYYLYWVNGPWKKKALTKKSRISHSKVAAFSSSIWYLLFLLELEFVFCCCLHCIRQTIEWTAHAKKKRPSFAYIVLDSIQWTPHAKKKTFTCIVLDYWGLTFFDHLYTTFPILIIILLIFCCFSCVVYWPVCEMNKIDSIRFWPRYRNIGLVALLWTNFWIKKQQSWCLFSAVKKIVYLLPQTIGKWREAVEKERCLINYQYIFLKLN